MAARCTRLGCAFRQNQTGSSSRSSKADDFVTLTTTGLQSPSSKKIVEIVYIPLRTPHKEGVGCASRARVVELERIKKSTSAIPMVDPPSQPRRAIVFSWRAFASCSALHIFRFAGSSQANQHVTRRAKGRHLACEDFIEAIFVARGNEQSAIDRFRGDHDRSQPHHDYRTDGLRGVFVAGNR